MEIATLLKNINAAHSTSFTVLKRYSDGEQGAYGILEQHTGQPYVLKWHGHTQNLSHLRSIAATVARLSTSGYPAPSYLLQGEFPEGLYTIQETLPGSPLYQLYPHFLSRLLALNAMQRQIGSRRNSWPREVVQTVLSGGQGYCQHESLLNFSLETRNLLFTLQELVSRHKDSIPPKFDIVHFDFQPYNILVQEQQITGVVDWEGSRSGDCIFDLVTLFYYSYEDSIVCQQLWRYILEHTSVCTAAVYLAHLLLRQLDWSLRFHSASEGLRYLYRAQSILHDLAPYKELWM